MAGSVLVEYPRHLSAQNNEQRDLENVQKTKRSDSEGSALSWDTDEAEDRRDSVDEERLDEAKAKSKGRRLSLDFLFNRKNKKNKKSKRSQSNAGAADDTLPEEAACVKTGRRDSCQYALAL